MVIHPNVQLLNSYLADIAQQQRMVFWIRSLDYQQQWYVSPNYEQVWGYPKAHLYQDPVSWNDTLVPTDKPKVLKGLEKRQVNSLNIEKEGLFFRFQRADGQQLYAVDHSFYLKDKQHCPTAIAGFSQILSHEEWVRLQEEFLQPHSVSLVTHLIGLLAGSLSACLPAAPQIFTDNSQYFINHAGQKCTLALREAQCLCYTSQGLSAKETARQLGISPRTVETYLERIRNKLKVRNKTALLGCLDSNSLQQLQAQVL